MSGETPDLGAMEREEAAAAWLVHLQSDSASEGDWLAFEAWLADPLNKAALDAIEAVSAEVEDNAPAILAALEATPAAGQRRPRPARRASDNRRVAWIAAFAAAAAAAIAFLAAPTLTRPRINEMVYAAAAGQRLAVTFPDGSSALLNQGASLRLRWGGAERQAILERGEASFKIMHDPEHVFRVTSGRESIVDLGTEFNVLDMPEMLVVTVREGSVRVSGDRVNPVDVEAASQARIDRVEQRVSLSQVNPAEAFAWHEGRLIYHNASLSDVVRDLNRYGEIPIRIANVTVGDLRFSGVLVIDTSEKMVSQVEAFLPVGSDRIREEIVLRAR